MTIPLLLDSIYLPNIQYVTWIIHHPDVCIEVNDHYQKRTWRNKMQLSGPDGPVLLSVPLLKGKHQGQKMTDVRIDPNQAWQRNHWRTIATLYGKSPFFPHYADRIQPLFNTNYTHLADLNWDSLLTIISILNLQINLTRTTRYLSSDPSGYLDLRGKIAYPVSKQAQRACPPYPQVFFFFLGFIANCSILDLIFCCGPEATLRMRDVNPELCS